MNVFEPISIGNVKLKNRIIRSATYEGCCDSSGIPQQGYHSIYEELAKNEVGAIITGFAFTSDDGKAMQPAQAGLDQDEKTAYFAEMTSLVHKYNCPIFLQISHAGRQTIKERSGGRASGSSNRRSSYFRTRTKALSTNKVYEKAEEYGLTARRAQKAGFDGVQIHAAHGYLIHQFLLPQINTRKDEFGIDKISGIGSRFLEEVILKVREYCGAHFPIIVKVSGGVDLKDGFSKKQFKELIHFLDLAEADCIEVSYGTMDFPLNIFRGDFPTDMILENNPFFTNKWSIQKYINRIILRYYRKKSIPLSPAYNLEYAEMARTLTNIPIISVGGFRNTNEISSALLMTSTDIVGMSRPFICEPDLVKQLKKMKTWKSACVNCNYCAVMCDSGRPTKCYKPIK